MPPFFRWPVHEVAISNVPLLVGGEADLAAYKVLDLTESPEKAFALGSVWVKANAGRSLNFNQTADEEKAKLSSSRATMPFLLRQLQGLSAIGAANVKTDAADFEKFVSASGAEDSTAGELRAVVLGTRTLAGTEPLQLVHVDAVIGRGSAVAVWAYDPADSTARVEFCVGHDCMEHGPSAEAALFRLISGKAAALGAEKMRCRVHFTEKGQVFVPLWFGEFGFQPATQEGVEAFAAAYAEKKGLVDATATRGAGAKEVDSRTAAVLAANQEAGEEYRGASMDATATVPEIFSGLNAWLRVLGLVDHLEAVNEWCEENGAATLEEVVDGREDLAECLGDALNEAERRTLLERTY